MYSSAMSSGIGRVVSSFRTATTSSQREHRRTAFRRRRSTRRGSRRMARRHPGQMIWMTLPLSALRSFVPVVSSSGSGRGRTVMSSPRRSRTRLPPAPRAGRSFVAMAGRRRPVAVPWSWAERAVGVDGRFRSMVVVRRIWTVAISSDLQPMAGRGCHDPGGRRRNPGVGCSTVSLGHPAWCRARDGVRRAGKSGQHRSIGSRDRRRRGRRGGRGRSGPGPVGDLVIGEGRRGQPREGRAGRMSER